MYQCFGFNWSMLHPVHGMMGGVGIHFLENSQWPDTCTSDISWTVTSFIVLSFSSYFS